jgi:hypothetical protein
MKQIKWNRTGMRMTNFESRHKTFNRYIDCVSTGNVIGRGQFSSYVRPHSETECNGFEFPPGHLRAHDLQGFHLTPPVTKWLKQFSETQVILYEFYHYASNDKPIVHGHIIQNSKNPRKLHLFTNPLATQKSASVLEEAARFLA